jgi:hypothetical protein
VRLNVTGTTIVNGVISASATNALAGGAGGSVFLTTGALSGNGAIRAGGIPGSWQLGGGGRVAVILTNGNDFGAVTIQAWPGSPTAGNGAFSGGGAGTVYLETKDQGSGGGTLLLDASNRACANVTPIGSNVTGTVVGTVAITNGAVLMIDSNQTLTVNGSWLNRSQPLTGSNTSWAAGFTSAPNSTVIFAGTNLAMVAGSNTFHNLTCTTAGKTLRFMAASTNVVRGQLTLDNGVTLTSTADGSWWYLTLASEGPQRVGRVNVKDSNASGGQTIRAEQGSKDLRHNVNWIFPAGATLVILQ